MVLRAAIAFDYAMDGAGDNPTLRVVAELVRGSPPEVIQQTNE
jgi:hypothetical protein